MTALEDWLAERAKEELEMLEAQHPSRFNYLKLELKSLICCVAADVDTSCFPPTSAAITQASCNLKRKSEWGAEPKQHRKKKARKSSASGGSGSGESGDGCSKKSDSSVDAAIRRAEACLQRIRQYKRCPWLIKEKKGKTRKLWPLRWEFRYENQI